jgi:hypothetical protein
MIDKLGIISNKRVRKEMYFFITKTNPNKKFEEFYEPNLINIAPNKLIFSLILKKNTITNITIIFNKTSFYPFSPPNVLINNNNYLSLLGCTNYFLNDINGGECLCCSSSICYKNWYVSTGIIKILKEIKENYIIKRRIIDRIWAKKITSQYLGYFVPIIDFL